MLKKVGQVVVALAILTAAVAIMAAEKQYDITVSSTITDNPRQIEFKVTVTNYGSKVAIFVPKASAIITKPMSISVSLFILSIT